MLSPWDYLRQPDLLPCSQRILWGQTLTSNSTLGERKRLSMSFVCTVAARLPDTCPRILWPYLAPGRLEVPMSSGTPTKAASSPSGVACTGSLIMEQMPTDRATNSELGGWFRGASEAWRLKRRLGSQSPATGRTGILG